MKLLNFLKSLQNKKNLDFKDLQIGQVVEIKYKDPKAMGFLNNTITCTRLNDDEMKYRVIKETVISKYRQKDLYKWLVGIKSFKKIIHNNEEISYEREYLFLEEEIEYIRELK